MQEGRNLGRLVGLDLSIRSLPTRPGLFSKGALFRSRASTGLTSSKKLGDQSGVLSPSPVESAVGLPGTLLQGYSQYEFSTCGLVGFFEKSKTFMQIP